MLVKFLDVLEEQKIPYCITHGYDDFLKSIDSDVDIIIPRQYLNDLKTICPGLKNVISIKEHSAGLYLVFVGERTQKGFPVLQVDASSGFRSGGYVLLSQNDFMHSKVHWEGKIWIPSISCEYAYLLLKQAAKGVIKNNSVIKIDSLLKRDSNACYEILRKYFNDVLIDRIMLASRTKTWDNKLLNLIRQSLYQNSFFLRIKKRITYLIPELIRIIGRILHPSGIFIVFLGIDGSGKTTAIDKLLTGMELIFFGIKTGHFRPGLLFRSNKMNAIAVSPHQKKPYPKFLSAIKVLTVWLDWVAGYFTEILPLKIKSNLIVYDRYFLDILLDPKRYRVDSPSWYIYFLNLLVPEPDIIFVLDTAPETAMARKAEIPLHELIEAELKYRELSGRKIHHIKCDRSVDEISLNIKEHIINYLENKFQ